LNLAVAHLLYAQLSNLPEGDLSRVRANLVNSYTAGPSNQAVFTGMQND
jgi:dsRNA-specific ribonuclease